jgi:hypothetical protein
MRGEICRFDSFLFGVGRQRFGGFWGIAHSADSWELTETKESDYERRSEAAGQMA